jgi:hypothetical protein
LSRGFLLEIIFLTLLLLVLYLKLHIDLPLFRS